MPWICSFKSSLKTHFSCASACQGPPACFSLSLSCVSSSFPFNSTPTTCPLISRLSTSFGDRFWCPDSTDDQTEVQRDNKSLIYSHRAYRWGKWDSTLGLWTAEPGLCIPIFQMMCCIIPGAGNSTWTSKSRNKVYGKGTPITGEAHRRSSEAPRDHPVQASTPISKPLCHSPGKWFPSLVLELFLNGKKRGGGESLWIWAHSYIKIHPVVEFPQQRCAREQLCKQPCSGWIWVFPPAEPGTQETPPAVRRDQELQSLSLCMCLPGTDPLESGPRKG